MLVLTEEEYLNLNGASRHAGSEPALHRTPGGFPKGVREFHLKRVQDAMRANAERRHELREEYRQKVEAGEIRPPTRLEKLRQAAAGHPDLASTQAAKRLLKKHEERGA